jgi:hypothetical protein
MAADFVLLDGDPLDDIRNTRRVAAVVKDGVVLGIGDSASRQARGRAEQGRGAGLGIRD